MDDDQPTLHFLREFLRKVGYEVLIARDGIEGLAIVCTTAVNVLVLDYHMPDMNGLDTVRRLCPTLPIVLFSGSFLDDSDMKLVNACIPKGGPPSVLLDTLKAVLLGSIGSNGVS